MIQKYFKKMEKTYKVKTFRTLHHSPHIRNSYIRWHDSGGSPAIKVVRYM